MASDDNSTKREVMYCEACKADREISVQRISDDKQQIMLECGHTFGKIVAVVNETIVSLRTLNM